MKKNNYRKIAKDVIELEIQALKKLKSSINNSFDQAVNAIVKCQSKIILCGVGKSGIIATKLLPHSHQWAIHPLHFLQVTLLMVTWEVFLKKIF